MPSAGHRIRVVGISGAGKSRLARQIAEITGLPRLELDAVFWDAGWSFRDLDDARALVARFAAEHPGGWVIEGNWSSRLDGLLDPGTDGGADTVVWLDHPRPLVMRRVIARTLRRGIRREELWHGNRERPSTWFSLDPHANIMLWAWTQHGPIRERLTAMTDAGWPVVRLRGQREVAAWLAELRSSTRGP
jgi:adenylate kinase family enzyme